MCRGKGNDSKNFKNLRNVCISALSAPSALPLSFPGSPPIIIAIRSPSAPPRSPRRQNIQDFLFRISQSIFSDHGYLVSELECGGTVVIDPVAEVQVEPLEQVLLVVHKLEVLVVVLLPTPFSLSHCNQN